MREFLLPPVIFTLSTFISLILPVLRSGLSLEYSTINTMDYKGQYLAELLFNIIIILFGGVAWVIGYFQQDFVIVFKGWLIGVILSVVVRTCMPCLKQISYSKCVF